MLGQLFRWISKLFSRQKSSSTPVTPSPSSPSPPSSSGSESYTPKPKWINPEAFRQATGIPAVRAQDWYGPVRDACVEFGITTPERISAFLAQVGHESGGFIYTREIWGPTAAQKRYEGRADLGNTNPGDGSKYRGRGLIQITGRFNYAAASRALDIDAIDHPEILETRDLAARSAAWWWASHGCNQLADSGDFIALTRRINGGTNGLADRMERWERAKAILGQ